MNILLMKCFSIKQIEKENAILSLNVNGTLPGIKMAVLSTGRSSVVHPLMSSPSQVLAAHSSAKYHGLLFFFFLGQLFASINTSPQLSSVHCVGFGWAAYSSKKVESGHQ